MRKQIAAANWKMNLTLAEGQQLVQKILDAKLSLKSHQLVLMGVPFPYLVPLQEMLKDQMYRFLMQICTHLTVELAPYQQHQDL